jgi:hypothetical protein
MMKSLLVAACLALPLAAVAAEEKKMTAQQNKMATCNKDAAAKKLQGDARKAFMKECLSGGSTAAPAKTAQQDKMTACNKQAGDKALKGDDRKKFMADCLKG